MINLKPNIEYQLYLLPNLNVVNKPIIRTNNYNIYVTYIINNNKADILVMNIQLKDIIEFQTIDKKILLNDVSSKNIIKFKTKYSTNEFYYNNIIINDYELIETNPLYKDGDDISKIIDMWYKVDKLEDAAKNIQQYIKLNERLLKLNSI